MKKKKQIVVRVPLGLKKKLEDRMSSYTGSISDGFILYLNQNIEILIKEGIIFKDVNLINKETGQIEYGQFSENIIKNLFQRPPYEGKKKLIKALIIAAFSDEWKDVYDLYFDENGNLKNYQSENIENVPKKTSVIKDQNAEFESNDPFYHMQYAEMLGKNIRDLENARKHYEKAIELLPNNDNFHSLYADFLNRQNIDLVIAKEHYEKVLELNGYSAQRRPPIPR